MTEVLLLKLLDFGLTAASIGLEREAVLEHARKRVAEGATPDDIARELFKMRDDAIAAAQGKIDGA